MPATSIFRRFGLERWRAQCGCGWASVWTTKDYADLFVTAHLHSTAFRNETRR